MLKIHRYFLLRNKKNNPKKLWNKVFLLWEPNSSKQSMKAEVVTKQSFVKDKMYSSNVPEGKWGSVRRDTEGLITVIKWST